MTFDPEFALSILPRILSTITTTLFATIIGCMGAAALGFLWEIVRRSSKPGRYTMRFLIDFIRSTPLLVQIYFFYFVLPEYGLTLPGLVVGVLALSLYYSGYLAEVFKGGIDSIPAGQFEAAKALGLSRLQLIMFVIAPQMLRNVAAPMGNYFVSLLKATPYLAIIAVPEMLSVALEIASETFRYTEPMTVVGIIFLTLALCFSGLVKVIESRLRLSPKAG
ncbi:ectoine/hydroxyectoine ABC transporter permease subunit EhuD [Phyllobacterium myrsinacearum]|uniref:Ectoine/hydroxyectoine ABC transporter permease subunit EhuD n=1 Tax=Phyllobacterium myrsinacearum TaxID=28101 RepID=A0A2S9JGT2_9HYPH|nr:ectoine/hydroxyectoine ABC transporter permease subunit EhuD [Phyllobacterium myrsinacearum]PRD52164.1 ectoine/hydroxyectoine ABC transporter permease subunit EhuD [Phyllobacterium myrsinacearum]PWV83791.1 polar amino acid transport system permease protein [Phyllobacterium myrsinacearum]RZS74137.1 polar amino acid transport system permease protein [Phyllobacterium myrsinacearum]RZV04689.1 polar amino acid transport system permease protein [Phyllobacterium myrsinacearum]